MNLNMKVHYGEVVRTSEYEDKVIIGNFLTGTSVKMTKECYEIINDCISKGIDIETYIKEYDEEDRKYLGDLFDLLLKRYIVFEEDSNDEKINTTMREVSLLLTNKCNLKCIHCCMEAGCSSETKELSTEEWKRVFDKLADLDLDLVYVSGGEPMIRNDFFELSEYLCSKLKRKPSLLTNGTLITEENVDRIVSLYDSFSISLDGADEESCAPIRGKGTFAKTIRGIELLKSRGVERLSLSFTRMKLNENKYEDFLKLAEKYNAKPMPRRLDLIGRASDHSELIPSDYETYSEPSIDYGAAVNGRFLPHMMPSCSRCAAGYRKITIDASGDIYPCQGFVIQGFDIGNVLEKESLKDYIESGEMRCSEGFKKFMGYHPADSKKCENCSAKLYCVSCIYQSYEILNAEDREELCEKRREVLKNLWN